MDRYFQNTRTLCDNDVRSVFKSNASTDMAKRVAHAHQGVDVLGRLKHYGIDFCFSQMAQIGDNFQLDLDKHQSEPWSDGSEKQLEFFQTLEDAVANETSVDGVLLSGGIDSLVLTLASSKELPCFTWDIEAGQTAFASYLCDKLGRRHYIIKNSSDEGDTKNSEMLEQAMFLRSQFLGHYLPWNSGIVSRYEFAQKKFLSGQNADTLLLIDTFAPVFNSFGARRKIELMRSRKHRKLLNELYLLDRLSMEEIEDVFIKILVSTLASNLEHVKLSHKSLRSIEIIRSTIVTDYLELINFKRIQNKGDYSFNLKKFKFARFIAPSIEAYRQQQSVFGLQRVLPFSSDRLLPLILNYLPAERNIYKPKSILYDYCHLKGIDFDAEKAGILRKTLGRAYLLKRFLSGRKFPHVDEAVRQMRIEASALGVTFNTCVKFLDLDDEDLAHKSNLMKLDRLLNYLSYTGLKI